MEGIFFAGNVLNSSAKESMNSNRGTNEQQKKQEENKQENQNPSYDEGSKSDPQMTELEGLKEGGKEPHVHKEDKPRDGDGKPD
jgi:hypothetical protein